jgi:hypothetical protein
MSKTITVNADGTVKRSRSSNGWKFAVKDLVASKPKPGTVIKREWLLEIFGLNEPTSWTRDEWEKFNFAWLYNMEKMRDTLLEEHCIDIRKLPRVGYEVIAPKDQTRIAMREGMNEIAKALTKTARRVLHVDTKQLSERGKRENLEALAHVQELRMSFSKHRRLSHHCYRALNERLRKAKFTLEEK